MKHVPVDFTKDGSERISKVLREEVGVPDVLIDSMLQHFVYTTAAILMRHEEGKTCHFFEQFEMAVLTSSGQISILPIKRDELVWGVPKVSSEGNTLH